jgi:arylsulfatase A-like enzyme
MTGARPDTTKVWDLVTHFRDAMPGVVTLGQHFKNHGYFVQGMGKIYHGGFDDTPTWSVPWQSPRAQTYGLPENNRYGRPAPEVNDGKSGSKKKSSEKKLNSRGPAFEGADVPDNTFQDGQVADLAIRTLGELKAKSQPFFLAVGFVKPHLPFVAPKKYWDLYDPAKIQLGHQQVPAQGRPGLRDPSRRRAPELQGYPGVIDPGRPRPAAEARLLRRHQLHGRAAGKGSRRTGATQAA